MKNFGTLKLADTENHFKVYVGLLNGDITVSPERFDWANGFVNVKYSGPHAGPVGQMNQYLNESVLSYLVESGAVVKSGESEDGFPYYEIA